MSRSETDYGDFTEFEVRCLVAEYCRSITLGMTGWGVSFKVWLELHDIARHDKMSRLIRLHPKNIMRPIDEDRPGYSSVFTRPVEELTPRERVLTGRRRGWKVGQLIAFVHGPGRTNIFRSRVTSLGTDGRPSTFRLVESRKKKEATP
jgi:hypothetical protein